MITIFIHIPSLIIGIVIGYILISSIFLLVNRFEPTDFQNGYQVGVKETERKYENGRTEEKPQQERED